MYHITAIDDKTWSGFVEKLNLNTFLHSKSWIDFNEQFGHKTWQLGMYNGKEISSIVFVYKIQAKRGTFLFCPHGPQMKNYNFDEFSRWFIYLRDLAKKEKCSCIRVSPIYENTMQNRNIFAHLGFRESPIHMHAELTTILDLTPALENILLAMRKTTRQLINKGENLIKSGEIVVKNFDSISDEMWEVYQSTANRGGFVPFSRRYLEQEYASFSKNDQCMMKGIYYGDTLLSWGLWIVSGKRCFYHQGANILSKSFPASYISHFQGIKWAKSQGCVSYDFWGVGPKDNQNHPWANISAFKRGFGGDDVELVRAQDYPLSWKYWILWAFETYRAKKRGF
jgi:lipid II:glycine glycyltransferase (peptidoglycan interpeptide bridge formation enzyme)